MALPQAARAGDDGARSRRPSDDLRRLPGDVPRVVAIGRLDINTEGLLLLTNDGGLARADRVAADRLAQPLSRARAWRGRPGRARELKDGLTVDGVDYRGIEAKLDRQQGSNVWLTMGLREGKNREIKRVLEHLGVAVNRLIRISFGPFELADMPEGAVVEIPTRVLRDQLGVRLAKKADADFEAPVVESVRPATEPQRPPAQRRDDGFEGKPRGARDGRADRDDRFRPRGGERAERRPPPASAPPPKKRKHISVLRAEARAEAEERRRVSRSATQDRKGRSVKVERISTARPSGAEPAPDGGRAPRSGPTAKRAQRAVRETHVPAPLTGRSVPSAPLRPTPDPRSAPIAKRAGRVPKAASESRPIGRSVPSAPLRPTPGPRSALIARRAGRAPRAGRESRALAALTGRSVLSARLRLTPGLRSALIARRAGRAPKAVSERLPIGRSAPSARLHPTGGRPSVPIARLLARVLKAASEDLPVAPVGRSVPGVRPRRAGRRVPVRVRPASGPDADRCRALQGARACRAEVARHSPDLGPAARIAVRYP